MEERMPEERNDLSSEVEFLRDPGIVVGAEAYRSIVLSEALLDVRGTIAPAAVPPAKALVLVDDETRSQLGITEVTVEQLVGPTNDHLPAWYLPVGAQRARAVCKIKASGIDFLGRSGSWSGTGVLVSQNILITNHHVLNSREVARGAGAIFNYETDPEGRLQPTKGFRFNPDRLFITSKTPGGLDFTFVWVENQPGTEFGIVPLQRSTATVKNGEFANIIQHPNGDPKTVVVHDNKVQDQDVAVVHYRSDTELGSSGSIAFNNEWMPIALHHARSGSLNEGIKFSAIAAYLETRTTSNDAAEAASAREALSLFRGTDEMMGFFGSLGRSVRGGSGLEVVVDSYKGEADDIDVGFWNLEWFNKNHVERMEDIGRAIVSMNLDIWALEETSPDATRALVEHLNGVYDLSFACAFSEPNAPEAKQSTAVIWNTRTVERDPNAQWLPEVDAWFRTHSKNFDDLDLGLEAVEGKIFDRYPGLFHFRARNRPGNRPQFDFYVVPLHLKAMGEGSKRRRMASEILAAAVQKMIRAGYDADWVVGGDMNAELASEDFDALVDGMTALSAGDEDGGAFTYVKKPKSLIDHIFLSANLASTYGEDSYFIVAADRTIPSYTTKISDHRPVLVRLSLRTEGKEVAAAEGVYALAELQRVLNERRSRRRTYIAPSL
jgi:V8-like Glu-specific endopeptidase